jgi:hypothetical protein
MAEYSGCLTTVGPALMAILHSAPLFWQAVTYEHILYLMVAMKLGDRAPRVINSSIHLSRNLNIVRDLFDTKLNVQRERVQGQG